MITEEHLFHSLALYEPIPFNETDYDELARIIIKSEKIQFDCYCTECEKDSTFKYKYRSLDVSHWSMDFSTKMKGNILNRKIPYELGFSCQRDDTHVYSFSFRIFKNEITKVGQFPSIASLENHTIKKYRTILKKDYRDFSKAIGLFSHGIGAGSFVYLRRIFENLIEEKRQEAALDPSWNDLEFQKSKMDEKIRMLTNHLPSILVENRKLYSILSKGIHELSEDDCLALFPNVKLAIELILDEKIYILEKQKKIQAVKNFVSSTVEQFKS